VLRMNTNGSRMIKEIEDVLKRNIMVIVTMSLDGIGSVHDYTRWPIKWTDYKNTVKAYKRPTKKIQTTTTRLLDNSQLFKHKKLT